MSDIENISKFYFFSKSKIVKNLTKSKNAFLFNVNNVICMWFAMADGPPRGAIWKH